MAYRRTKPVFVWIAAIPILLLAAASWRRGYYRELMSSVEHSRAVQVAIHDLIVSLTDAETGRQGYVLTANPNYLTAMNAAAANSSAQVQRLASLTQDNPVQRASVDVLKHLVADQLAFVEQAAQLGRAGADKAVEDLARREGLPTSAELSKVTAEMMAEEGRLLDLRTQATEKVDLEANALLIAGSLATILLLIFAFRIVSRYAAGRDRAEAEVRSANHKLEEKVHQLDRLNAELEQRISERTASLARSNQELQNFAFVASHDLQEPLRMVASCLALLKNASQGRLDGEAEKYISFAMESAARLQTLIRDLLSYAQVNSQPPAPVPARLDELVSQARYSLLASVRETDAEITVGPLPEVDVDPLKLSLVFQNLFSNAIKFRRPGEKPRIHVEARREAQGWLVSVSDRGIGFDAKFSEKIFGAFQRLHGKSEYPGSGIGLAICKRIIEGHGGRIWAEGRPGDGATFYFTLPAAAGSLLPPAAVETASWPHPEPESAEKGARASGSA